jgi:hypothetical protein
MAPTKLAIVDCVSDGDQLIARNIGLDDRPPQSLPALAAQLIGFVLLDLLEHLGRARTWVRPGLRLPCDAERERQAAASTRSAAILAL